MDEPPPPPPPPEDGFPPPVRKRSLKRILLLWVGLPIGILGSLILLGVLYVATGSEHPVSAADRAVLVTAALLGENADWLEPVPNREVTTKIRYLDGSWELSCEYEHPEEEDYVYLLCTVRKERSRRAAATQYSTAGTAIELGLKVEDLELRDRDDLTWGRKSRSVLLVEEGEPAGHWFRCMENEKIFELLLSGMYFEDGEDFAAFLKPVLENLYDWEPDPDAD